jgi:hypothetical protein
VTAPPGTAPAAERAPSRLGGAALWALLATLGALVVVNIPQLGSDPWPFEPPAVEPQGVLAPLVRAADGEWDLALLRGTAILAGLLVAAAAVAALSARPWPRPLAIALALATAALLLVPPVALQLGLREATAPWFFTNDSTYQIELAGDLVLEGRNPYGHDYRRSGMERFYSFDGSVTEETREEQVALRHFAYFPGTPLTSAAWRLLPAPLDDYRVLVLVSTLGLLGAALLVRAPFEWTLAAGAVLAANPLAVRAAWFGTADAPSLLLLVLAVAAVTRSRYAAAAACLGGAILLKQFALVALPFFALMLLTRRVPRAEVGRAGGALAAVVAAGTLPFLVADLGALWDDTVAYGGETYRIIGYGLAGTLLRLGVVDDRWGDYPFLPLVLAVWLPVTAWLLWRQRALATLSAGAVGFTVSMFLLLYLGRVFQLSYLIWPLTGLVLAAVLAAAERRYRTSTSTGPAGSETLPAASTASSTTS